VAERSGQNDEGGDKNRSHFNNQQSGFSNRYSPAQMSEPIQPEKKPQIAEHRLLIVEGRKERRKEEHPDQPLRSEPSCGDAQILGKRLPCVR